MYISYFIMSCCKAKSPLCPVKTQLRLGIHLVSPVFILCAMNLSFPDVGSEEYDQT